MSRRTRIGIRRAKRKQSEQRGYLHSTANEVAVRSNVLALEDRRLWAPSEEIPRGLFHRSSRLVVTSHPNVNKHRSSNVPSHIRFSVPREVAYCVRRKQRREVLFAQRKTGKGSKSRQRRRNAFSSISC